MSSYQYRKSHCGDKTVVRSSYLHNGISSTSKMASLYWISPQVISGHTWCWHGSPRIVQFQYQRGVIITHPPPLDKMVAILADDNFYCIFLNGNVRIPNKISLKYVPRSPVDNREALVQLMAWCWTGDKPLPGPMMTQFIDASMLH